MGYYYYSMLFNKCVCFKERHLFGKRSFYWIEKAKLGNLIKFTIERKLTINKEQMNLKTQLYKRYDSIRREPERFEFFHEISQSDSDSRTYEKVMSDMNSRHWQQAMQSKMDFMYSNKV